MKIKTSNLKELYVYIFVAFVVMKVWRAFSGSDEHGGIWNYIQVFFVVFGFFALIKFINLVKKEAAVMVLVIYSVIALLISLLTFKVLSVYIFFDLIKVTFTGMTAVVFYSYGFRTDSIDKHKIILKVMFYVSSAILCIRIGIHMLSGGYRASGAGAVADVYFILGVLPYILSITKKKFQLIPIFVTALSILISQKRAGFIALVGVVIIFYFVSSIKKNSLKNTIGKIIIFSLIIVCGYYLILFLDAKLNLEIFIRLKMLETDGGSGRYNRWIELLLALKRSRLLHLVFGHGYNAVKDLIGTHAHNDFLEVFYNFGFVSLLLYLSYYIFQIFNAIKMAKEGYEHFAEFLASLFVSLCIALFSYYVIDATYSICGCFTQFILLADWRKTRASQFEAVPETELMITDEEDFQR